MSVLFEELDYWPTPIGALTLRRRRELTLGTDVYEIRLGDESLMSSLFTVSEVALARLALADLSGSELDVVVGGLGLGYTTQAVLAHSAVGSVLVIEMLEGVLEWHRSGLVPLGPQLIDDPRCRLIQGDFFTLARSATGLDPDRPGRRFHAILVDIDHSPSALLSVGNRAFYTVEGLRSLAAHLRPGGVFGLWSNEEPEPSFTERLRRVFPEAGAEPVTFHNPLQGKPLTQTVYLARTELDER